MPTQLARPFIVTPIFLLATFSEKPHIYVGTKCGIKWTGVTLKWSLLLSKVAKVHTADDTAETASEWQVSRQRSDHLWKTKCISLLVCDCTSTSGRADNTAPHSQMKTDNTVFIQGASAPHRYGWVICSCSWAGAGS